jgi:hypothetical protein
MSEARVCVFRNYASFFHEAFSAPRSIPKLKNHALSSFRDCLFNVFATTLHIDGFGGLVVSMLASGTRIRGFKPGRSRCIWKILRMPSFGGDVKESDPCPSFVACKRTQYLRELRCASKIPCIVPSFASRGLSCLCGAWRHWRWMRGTHWGQGYNRPTGCSAEKAPQATANF